MHTFVIGPRGFKDQTQTRTGTYQWLNSRQSLLITQLPQPPTNTDGGTDGKDLIPF
jgi:hypothetical protein